MADELGVLTIAIAAGGTATWTFNPTPDSTGNPSFSFTATVTDADGDVDADTHTISITEGAPPTSSGTLALVVDEKDLADGTTAGGNAGGEAGNPDTVDVETGGLVFTSGSDAIASIRFDLAAGQPTTGTGLDNLAGITWALSGDGLTLTGSIGATPVITLVLSGQLSAAANGATAAPTVTATLLSEFPHENLADADTLTISGIRVVALDSDGTGLAAPATISVQVIDDEPSVEIAPAVADATPTTDTVAENGADLSGAITLVEGADQDATLVVSLTGATGGPLTFTLNGTAQSQSATVTQGADELGVLTIAIAAGGTATWTFNPTPDSTGNPSFSFTATVTDADGDVDADTHTISITEGAPPTSSGTLALVVDEKDLADGTTAGGNAGGEAGNPDTVDVETGGLVFTSGSDAIASIRFDLAAGQPTTGTGLDNLAGITWALSGDGLTLTGSIGATPVITLVLSGQLSAAAKARRRPRR